MDDLRFTLRRSIMLGLPAAMRIAACVVPVWLLGAPASGQQTAAEMIEPRVDRQQFAAFVQQVNFGADQRRVAEMMFADYTAALTTLAQRLDEQAVAGGRKRVEDALAGRARVAPDELRELRAAVLKTYQQSWPEADRAVDELLGGVQALLSPEQEAAYAGAARRLRREIYLHPRQAGREQPDYAGEGVDVLQLAEQALAPGADLQGLTATRLGAVLAGYEQQLDALLVQSFAAYRQASSLRKLAMIQNDAAARAIHEQALVDVWQALYQLNSSTVRQVGELAAAELGPAARDQWLLRFDQASFGWLFTRRKPDRQIEWIMQQQPGDAAVQKAQEIYQSYVASRAKLARKAMDLVLRARLEHHVLSLMDPSGQDNRAARALYEELLRITGEQSNLDSSTAMAIEAALDEAPRQRLRDAMNRSDTPRRR